MVIAVDIGNSSIKVGYFTGSRLIVQKIGTHPAKAADEYAAEIEAFMNENPTEKKGEIGVIISSVVGGYEKVLRQAFELFPCKQDSEILIAGYGMETEMQFRIDNPRELGSDRIAGAVGAYELYRSAVAVADFGTATTMSLVDASGNFLGGAIMPGVELMNSALERGTSKLKKIALDPPLSALGRNTADCILSGLFYGTAGATERILFESGRELKTQFKLVITGGYSSAMTKLIGTPHELCPNLTLEGLRILYEKNCKRRDLLKLRSGDI